MTSLSDSLNDCRVCREGGVFHLRFGFLVVGEGFLEKREFSGGV